jgi:hypothetical protein
VQTLLEQINEEKLPDLAVALDKLGKDLSAHNAAMGGRLTALSGNVTAFKADMDSQLASVNLTLRDLQKLNSIITNLGTLSKDVDEANAQIGSVKSTEDKDYSKVNLQTGLLLVILILMFVVIGLMFMRRAPPPASNPGGEQPQLRPAGKKGDWEELPDSKE